MSLVPAEATTAAAPTVSGPGVTKTAASSYYKSPAQFDVSTLQYTLKPKQAVGVGAGSGSGFDTTTFNITIRSPTADPVAAEEQGRRAAGQQRPSHFTIKPDIPLRTKHGISIAVAGKDKDKEQILKQFRENPRIINGMALGTRPMPPDTHFEIIFFLDLSKEEDRTLERLSDSARDSFKEYIRRGSAPGITLKRDAIVNGFVRTSDTTDDRYIVCGLSTSHTVGSQTFKPTRFMSKNSEPIIWSALIRQTFFADIEFKVSHVMMVGTGRASFKVYVNNVQLIEEPKTSLSAERQAQEAYEQQMRAAVEKDEADAAQEQQHHRASSSPLAVDDKNDEETLLDKQLADLHSKAREQKMSASPAEAITTSQRPAPPRDGVAAKTVTAASTKAARKKKSSEPAPPPPPAESDAEDDTVDHVPSGQVTTMASSTGSRRAA